MQNEPLTLLILPTRQVKELELLKKTDFQYVESLTENYHPDDIDESLRQIREFYGKDTNAE